MLAVHRDIDAGTYMADRIHSVVFGDTVLDLLDKIWVREMKKTKNESFDDPFDDLIARREHG